MDRGRFAGRVADQFGDNKLKDSLSFGFGIKPPFSITPQQSIMKCIDYAI